jgi:predicted XRE-type DNA-binding protein
MMEHEQEDVHSRRIERLAKKLHSKRYRDSYLSSHIRMFLANQLASLQGEMSQKEFGQLLGKPQPIVSRLQNPDYGKYSLQTLLEIASKLDVALLVRFVDYPTFLKVTSDFSDEALRPARYDQSQMDLLATKSYFTGHSIAAGEMAHASPVGGMPVMGGAVPTPHGMASFIPWRHASIGGSKNG